MNIEFTIYSRPDCHLCDEMLAQLCAITQVTIEQITKVNIETDPALVAQYGARIPVLVANDEELCEGHLDPAAVTNFIDTESNKLYSS